MESSYLQITADDRSFCCASIRNFDVSVRRDASHMSALYSCASGDSIFFLQSRSVLIIRREINGEDEAWMLYIYFEI